MRKQYDLEALALKIQGIKEECADQCAKTPSRVSRFLLRRKRDFAVNSITRALADRGVAWYDRKAGRFADRPTNIFQLMMKRRRVDGPSAGVAHDDREAALLASFHNTGRYFDANTGVVQSNTGKYL